MIYYTFVSDQEHDIKDLIARWANIRDLSQAAIFKSEARRCQYLGVRSALRALLAEVTGKQDWNIIPTAQGKPELFTEEGLKGPNISLSHTHGLVACAVSQDCALGVDVEYWRDRDFRALAEYSFGPQECEEVRHHGVSAFYRIWTLNEALCKAKGKGLFSYIDGCDHVMAAPDIGLWKSKNGHLFYDVLYGTFSLALALENESITLANIRCVSVG